MTICCHRNHLSPGLVSIQRILLVTKTTKTVFIWLCRQTHRNMERNSLQSCCGRRRSVLRWLVRTDWLSVGWGFTGGLGNQNNLADNQVKCSSHVNSLFSPSSPPPPPLYNGNRSVIIGSGKIEFLNRFLRTHLINPQQSCRVWGHPGSWFGDQLSLLLSTCLF